MSGPDFVSALSVELSHVPLAADQIVSGSPATGSMALGDFDGHEYGVWEHSVGSSSDIEADEVFVVLGGVATVTFADGTVLTLTPGTVGRLREGQHTVWDVTETLRKVYFS